MVLPQLSQADETSHDYNTILDQLTRVYDNPNKMQEAEDKLYALKQGTDCQGILLVDGPTVTQGGVLDGHMIVLEEG
jgi:hypothetical protein